ncbi:hypothetical protein NRB56_76110 [Nocardia sp. RB56]|uniref:Uncharacterized protein n=1 Tax=Nocardia aurantia TaxID=2585199 RepID=A0A7K0E2G7_9NOCA|nr:hypothetical protein [Nocardia aurantia]
MRSAGYDGSIGTYPAPDLITASNATTKSAERGRITATRTSGPAPNAINLRAN